MSQKHPGFIETIAELLRRHLPQLPMDIVAVCGEVIAIDARLRSYQGVKSKLGTAEELDAYFEVYEALLARYDLALQKLVDNRDSRAFLSELEDVKRQLNAYLS